jgi:hypothetical protein
VNFDIDFFKVMKRLLFLVPAVLVACSPAIDTASLERDYITAYPDAAVSCRVKEPYVLCSIVSKQFTSKQGLWIYENDTFFAVNGKALNAAEKMRKELYPEANTVDIPGALSQFE